MDNNLLTFQNGDLLKCKDTYYKIKIVKTKESFYIIAILLTQNLTNFNLENDKNIRIIEIENLNDFLK